MIKVWFGESCTESRANPAYKCDYGQELMIYGLELPAVVETHFSRDERGISVLRTGTSKGGVTIVPVPDECLANAGKFYCYIFDREAMSGKTVYKIEVEVRKRPGLPTETEEPTGDDLNYFSQVMEDVAGSAELAQAAKEELMNGISIGTVETLEAGADATASITETEGALELNLGIPQGEKGEKGETGISLLYANDALKEYTKGTLTKTVFDWSGLGTTTYPTGWRTGYVYTDGDNKSSGVYIRSAMMPHTLFGDYEFMLITPPNGYFVWAIEFDNDYVSTENFVECYGDPDAKEINTPILVPLGGEHGYVINLGRFETGTASTYLTSEFVATIKCELFASDVYTKSQIDSMLENVIPDNSITLAKLASDVIDGDLANNNAAPSVGLLKDLVGGLKDYISSYINNLYDKTALSWSMIATQDYSTGWRAGYIDNTGTHSSSFRSIRSMLITYDKVKNYDFIILTPPDGYFVWVAEYENDYASASNFIAMHGDYSQRVRNIPIFVPIRNGRSFVVNIGRFADNDASNYLTNNFISTIKCDLYSAKKINENPYKNKKLSLLGDSMSAHEDDIPSGNKAYYKDSTEYLTHVTDKSQMWYRVLCADLGMEPLVINGWSGSCVTRGVRNDTTYVPASDPSRCENLHSGDVMPDVILLAIGTNDYSYMDNANQMGDWDGSTALGSESDLSDYADTDFCRAYATMLARVRKKYPNANIFCLTPWFCERNTTDTGVTYLNAIGKKESDYGDIIKKIAGIMGVKVIDATNIGFSRYNYSPTYAEDSPPAHMNATGQAYAGHAIAKAMMECQ